MVKTIANIFQFTCMAERTFLLLLFTPFFIAFFCGPNILGLIVARIPHCRRANNVMAMTIIAGQSSSIGYTIILPKRYTTKKRKRKITQILTEFCMPNPIERCRRTACFKFHFIYFIIIVYSDLHCIIYRISLLSRFTIKISLNFWFRTKKVSKMFQSPGVNISVLSVLFFFKSRFNSLHLV